MVKFSQYVFEQYPVSFDIATHWLEQDVILVAWFLIIYVMRMSQVNIAGHACQAEMSECFILQFSLLEKITGVHLRPNQPPLISSRVRAN